MPKKDSSLKESTNNLTETEEETPKEESANKKPTFKRFNPNWKEEREKILQEMKDFKGTPEEIWAEYARRRGFDEDEVLMLRALRQVESGGNVKAVSPVGARGAFQFMPSTAKVFGISNIEDETQSGIAAVDYLAKMYEQFYDYGKTREDIWNYALQGYNAGENRILRTLAKGKEPKVSANYVEKIFSEMVRLREGEKPEEEEEVETKPKEEEKAKAEPEEEIESKPEEEVLKSEEEAPLIRETTVEKYVANKEETDEAIAEVEKLLGEVDRFNQTYGDKVALRQRLDNATFLVNHLPSEKQRAARLVKLARLKEKIDALGDDADVFVTSSAGDTIADIGNRLNMLRLQNPQQFEEEKERAHVLFSFTSRDDDWESPQAAAHRRDTTRAMLLAATGGATQAVDKLIEDWGKRTGGKFYFYDTEGNKITLQRGQTSPIFLRGSHIFQLYNDGRLAGKIKPPREVVERLDAPTGFAKAMEDFSIGVARSSVLMKAIGATAIGLGKIAGSEYLMDYGAAAFMSPEELQMLVPPGRETGWTDFGMLFGLFGDAYTFALAGKAVGGVVGGVLPSSHINSQQIARGIGALTFQPLVAAIVPQGIKINPNHTIASLVYDKDGKPTERTWSDVFKAAGVNLGIAAAMGGISAVATPFISRPLLNGVSSRTINILESIAPKYGLNAKNVYDLVMRGAQATTNVLGDLTTVIPGATVRMVMEGKPFTADNFIDAVIRETAESVVAGYGVRTALGRHVSSTHFFKLTDANYGLRVDYTANGIVVSKVSNVPDTAMTMPRHEAAMHIWQLLAMSSSRKQREFARKLAQDALGENYGRDSATVRRIEEQYRKAGILDYLSGDDRDRTVAAKAAEGTADSAAGDVYLYAVRGRVSPVTILSEDNRNPNVVKVRTLGGNPVEFVTTKSALRKHNLYLNLNQAEAVRQQYPGAETSDWRVYNTARKVDAIFSKEALSYLNEAFFQQYKFERAKIGGAIDLKTAAYVTEDGKLLMLSPEAEIELRNAERQRARAEFPDFTTSPPDSVERAQLYNYLPNGAKLRSTILDENGNTIEIDAERVTPEEWNAAADNYANHVADTKFSSASTLPASEIRNLVPYLPIGFENLLNKVRSERIGIVHTDRLAMALNALHESRHVTYGALALSSEDYKRLSSTPLFKEFKEKLSEFEGRAISDYAALQEAIAYGETGEVFPGITPEKMKLVHSQVLKALRDAIGDDNAQRVADELALLRKSLTAFANKWGVDVDTAYTIANNVISSVDADVMRDARILSADEFNSKYTTIDSADKEIIFAVANKRDAIPAASVFETIPQDTKIDGILRRIEDFIAPRDYSTDYRRIGFYSPLLRTLESEKLPNAASLGQYLATFSRLKKQELDDIRIVDIEAIADVLPDDLKQFIKDNPRALSASELFARIPPDTRFTKAQLAQLVEKNYPIIAETTYGANIYARHRNRQLAKALAAGNTPPDADASNRDLRFGDDTFAYPQITKARYREHVTAPYETYAEVVIRDLNKDVLTSKELHFGDTGIISWFRYGLDGKDLNVEEIQSDYRQMSKYMFAPRPLTFSITEERMLGGKTVYTIVDETGELASNRIFTDLSSAEHYIEHLKSGVSNLIGVGKYLTQQKTWEPLTLRRIIFEAQRTGAERIKFTSADTQVARWDFLPEATHIELYANGTVVLYRGDEPISVLHNVPMKSKISDFFGSSIGEALWEKLSSVYDDVFNKELNARFKIEKVDDDTFVLKTKVTNETVRAASSKEDLIDFIRPKIHSLIDAVAKAKIEITEEMRAERAQRFEFLRDFYDNRLPRQLEKLGLSVYEETDARGFKWNVVDVPQDEQDFPLYRIADRVEDLQDYLKRGYYAILQGSYNNDTFAVQRASMLGAGFPHIVLPDNRLLVPLHHRNPFEEETAIIAAAREQFNIPEADDEALMVFATKLFNSGEVIFGRNGELSILDIETGRERFTSQFEFGAEGDFLFEAKDGAFALKLGQTQERAYSMPSASRLAEWKAARERALTSVEGIRTSYDLYTSFSPQITSDAEFGKAAMILAAETNPAFNTRPIQIGGKARTVPQYIDELLSNVRNKKLSSSEANKKILNLYESLATPEALRRLSEDAYQTMKKALDSRNSELKAMMEFYTGSMSEFIEGMDAAFPGFAKNYEAQRALYTLLAITSLNSSVPANLINAAKYMRDLLNLTIDTLPPPERGNYILNVNRVAQLISTNEKPQYIYSDALWQRIKQARDSRGLIGVMEVLSEDAPGEVTIAQHIFGSKLGAYLLNLHGFLELVTIDRHQNRWIGRVIGTPAKIVGEGKNASLESFDDLTASEKRMVQVGDKKVELRIDTVFQRMGAAAISSAAERLRAEGYDVTPAQVQALLWGIEKDIWSRVTGRKPPLESYHSSLENLLKPIETDSPWGINTKIAELESAIAQSASAKEKARLQKEIDSLKSKLPDVEKDFADRLKAVRAEIDGLTAELKQRLEQRNKIISDMESAQERLKVARNDAKKLRRASAAPEDLDKQQKLIEELINKIDDYKKELRSIDTIRITIEKQLSKRSADAYMLENGMPETSLRATFELALKQPNNLMPLRDGVTEIDSAVIDATRGATIRHLAPHQRVVLFRSADELEAKLTNEFIAAREAAKRRHPTLSEEFNTDNIAALWLANRDYLTPEFRRYAYNWLAKLFRDTFGTLSRTKYGDKVLLIDLKEHTLHSALRAAMSDGYPRVSPELQPIVDEILADYLASPYPDRELLTAAIEAKGYDSVLYDGNIVPLRSIYAGVSPYPKSYASAIESSEFKTFFGDWETDIANASKVVDADGTPKVVFHGTYSTFETFNVDALSPVSYWGKAIYATDNPDEAYYAYATRRRGAKSLAQLSEAERQSALKSGGIVMPLWLSIRNPFHTDNTMWNAREAAEFVARLRVRLHQLSMRYPQTVDESIIASALPFLKRSDEFKANKLIDALRGNPLAFTLINDDGLVFHEGIRKALEDMGYDGVIDTITSPHAATHYVAFKPQQARSLFDVNSNDVLYRWADIPTTPSEWRQYAKKNGIDDDAILDVITSMAERNLPPDVIIEEVIRHSRSHIDLVTALFKANLLASVETQMMSVKANMLAMPFRATAHLFAKLPDIALQLLGAAIYKENLNLRINLKSVLEGLKSVPFGLKMSKDMLKAGFTLKPGGHIDFVPKISGTKALDNIAGRYANSILALTNAIDAPFAEFYFRSALDSVARKLMDKNPGLSYQEAVQLPQALDYAFRVMEVNTWKNSNVLSDVIAMARRKELPAPFRFFIELTIPFSKVGGNFIIDMADYLTFGLAGKFLRTGGTTSAEVASLRERIRDVLTNPIVRDTITYAAGQGMTGIATVLAAYYLTKEGIVEIIPWFDKDDRDVLAVKSKNAMYMSVKLGNHYYKIEQMPGGYLIALGARLAAKEGNPEFEYSKRKAFLETLGYMSKQLPLSKYFAERPKSVFEREAGFQFDVDRFIAMTVKRFAVPRLVDEAVRESRGRIKRDYIVTVVDEKTGRRRLDDKGTLIRLLFADLPYLDTAPIYVTELGDTIELSHPIFGRTTAREAPAAEWLYKIGYNPRVRRENWELNQLERQKLKEVFTKLALSEDIRRLPIEVQRSIAEEAYSRLFGPRYAPISIKKLEGEERRKEVESEIKGRRKEKREVTKQRRKMSPVLRKILRESMEE